MQKAIELVKLVSKHPEKMWSDEIQEINLLTIFAPLFNLGFKPKDANLILCFIVYAYDNDSQWLNLKQDRYDNKVRIMKGVGLDLSNDLIAEIVDNENSPVNQIIVEYLIEQTTWKWNQIMSLIDQHQTIMRFVSQKTDEQKQVEKLNKEGDIVTLNQQYGDDALAKILKTKNELLTQGVQIRRDADELLSEIRKEFVQVDNAVQQAFGFELTATKNIDPMSWRLWIVERNKRKASTN